MEFSYENICLGDLVECGVLGFICNADKEKIEVEHYDKATQEIKKLKTKKKG